MYRLGVRSMLLLNKFDNPLTGVRFDSGPVGVVINGGNKLSAGSYWSARTCTGPLADNEIFQPEPRRQALLHVRHGIEAPFGRRHLPPAGVT